MKHFSDVFHEERTLELLFSSLNTRIATRNEFACACMTIEGLVSLDEIGYLEWGWSVNPLMIKNRMITVVYFSARVE